MALPKYPEWDPYLTDSQNIDRILKWRGEMQKQLREPKKEKYRISKTVKILENPGFIQIEDAVYVDVEKVLEALEK